MESDTEQFIGVPEEPGPLGQGELVNTDQVLHALIS
jgi:hypothetical protein